MPASLIDQQFLEKLERLTLRWRKSFPGLVGGHNLSRFAGAGQEFLDHRNFHHGDDLRAVNWRAYLRLDKLFLKMFRVEPRVPVRILIDTSQSMATGDPGATKFEYAQRLVAALVYVGLVRLDSITIHPFASGLGEPHMCSGGRYRFGPATDFLAALKPSGATDFYPVARQFVNRYMNRGLVVVVSDFLSETDPDKPLQFLTEFGHEPYLVQLWNDQDRTPPWEGELDIEDAETGRHLELDFDAEARARYTAAFDEFTTSIRRTALRNRGRYVGLPTSLTLEEALFGPMALSGGVQ